MIGSRISAYEVLSELGSGGMGAVYLAECAEAVAGLDVSTKVALKVIHPNLLSQPGFFKRFLREAQIGQDVQHENVVRTYDCDATFVDGQQHNFLVMEYVEGQTLRSLLDELERVPEELCRHIGREVAKGLAAIHEAGVVHRDIKPENVLITEQHVVKVMDLGVARLQDEAIRLSRAGAFVGSLEYAAPEQFRSADGEPDGRADLHSLGVVLYELATGHHPYRDEDASKVLRNILDQEPRKAGEVNPQLSPFFEEVVGALIAKDRDARFADAAALVSVLEAGESGDWWKSRAKALRIETKRPLRRIRIPRETALYGRDDDLAKLHALYDKARAGEGQVLLIEGEAGIGKTRLVDEFVGRLRQEGEDVNFLFGSYPPGGAATAAGAFSEAYREQFGEEGSAPWLSQTPILVPAFDALLRGEPAPKDAEALTKESLGTVFVHATRNLAAERPTIVLIDDLHFAPEDARSLFMTLALALPGHPTLLVGTMRPGVSEAWVSNVTRLEHASHAALSRLGPKDLTRLLKDAFRSERLAEELGFKIAEKSDGNPFFAFEIIRGLREGQFITQRPDGTWVTTRVIADIDVPSSILDLVQARLSDLTAQEKDLLDVAACCGFSFDPSLVAEVVGLSRLPVLKQFGRIEHGHWLIRSTGRSYTFDHHQVQECIYAALHEQLREEYHGAVAEALAARVDAAEGDRSELEGDLCAELCEHYFKADRGEDALRYLEAALQHLLEGHMNDQAITLIDRALACSGLLAGEPRAQLLLQKNKLLFILGRREEQERVLSEVERLAQDLDDPALRLSSGFARAQLEQVVGSLETAVRSFELLLQASREAGDREREAAALVNLGGAHWHIGRLDVAEGNLSRGRKLCREIGHRSYESRATSLLGLVSFGLDRHEQAREFFEQAIEIANEAGDTGAAAAATANLGALLLAQGRLKEARPTLERAVALCRAVGHRHFEANALGTLGSVLMNLGEVQEGVEKFERWRDVTHAIGARVDEAKATCALALSKLSQGRLEAALAQQERSVAIARTIGDREGEAAYLRECARVHLELGRMEDARFLADRALAMARDLGDLRTQAKALATLGAIADESADSQDARDLSEQALSIFRELNRAAQVAEMLERLGDLRRRSTESDGAADLLAEAIDLFRAQGTKPSEASVLVSLANLSEGDAAAAEAAVEEAGEAGNTTHTRFHLWTATGKLEHLVEAKRLLDFRVEHAPEECRESMLANVRLNREIMQAWEEHQSQS